jgi:hypothetical protein
VPETETLEPHLHLGTWHAPACAAVLALAAAEKEQEECETAMQKIRMICLKMQMKAVEEVNLLMVVQWAL